MQANASSKTVRKFWSTFRIDDTCYLAFGVEMGRHELDFAVDITGASPAYVEAVVEELNIRVNDMMYNLGRIAV